MNQEVLMPVRGTEDSILRSPPQKGYVYFALDTKKIFYSDGESFLPMGGNSGVWYGKMEYAETPEESQVEFNFRPDEIEGNENVENGKYNIPNIDDLIFNTPDSCFYRVIDIDKDGNTPILHCYKLTVAGSGGPGGGGGSAQAGSMTVSRLNDQIINTLQGNECYIKYRFIAKDASGEETGPGEAALYVDGILKSTFIAAQGDNEIDVGPYITVGTNAIRLVVSGSTGGISNISQSKNWTIISTNLSLSWNYDDTTINTSKSFTFNWSVSISLQHTTHILIDDIYEIDIPSINTLREKTYTISDRLEYGLIHGSHTVKMYLTAEIGGKIFTSNSVVHKVICVDADERSDTIISVSLPSQEINQYDTISIGIVLYDPISADGKVSAELREDGHTVDRWENYENGVQYFWNYTPIEAGSKILTILSGTSEENISITVNDLGLSISEILGYDFRFKASEIISNNYLQNWSYNNITPIFSEDFDWINGGLKSEKDEQGNDRNYILIKAGSKLTFDYKPLANVSSQRGFDIKIIFKVLNCRSYDARALTIGTPETDNIYLMLSANEGIFKSSNSTVTVPYCENSYLEFEVDAWPYGTDGKQAYLMTWIDGVPTSASSYVSEDIFDNQKDTAKLVIGSNDCDVQLYMVKVYKNHLTNEQHLMNFIMDASNAAEIVSRYNRNDILDDNGDISYKKLIEKNPDCDVYLYDIPRMTTTKKDTVSGCHYERYKGKNTAQQTADNVTIAVQGTSSAAYGLAAFNFNSTFNDGFTDYSENSNGVHIDKWAMSKDALPINDFNTKVNVASCEGVNNALNQEYYDKLVNYVYKTEYKNKEPKSRHTMQFMNMGVVFIKDRNPVTDSENGVGDNLFKDTEGYVQMPDDLKPYKLYSICNMGNIKRNTGVFSDPNNPYDVIMENPDNQSVYQQMTGLIDYNGKLKGQWSGAKFYPVLETETYEKTKDKEIKAGKDYYIKSNDEYILENSPTVENIGKYYERKSAGSLSSTEVFEWRALPEDAWDYMTKHNIIPPTFNGKPNTKTMTQLANDAWTDLVAWFAANNPNAATNMSIPEETYAPYTFKGYTSIPDRIDMEGNPMEVYGQGNSSILKGLTISTYAGTYTTDSKERRMAKMLAECEDHLIMDEIVFHYLFIERHCLIDNVAKNTFWHTEDLQHWSMIKDYDNDTSDGNDNSGHLTLTYGYEVLDHVDYDESKSFVFNASSSVWLHFINGLLEARTRMYQALDSGDIKAWDAEPYLKLFEEWQSRVPERVWIADYYRKYLRPKEIYGATQFLPMLEGGKKTHQRNRFETYEDLYMSSEYFGRKCQSSQIDIRANGTNINQMKFPMQMYSNCYIRAAAGSGHDPNVRTRYKRGETAEIVLPVTGDANDMTTYFYLANYITSLKNIEYLKPKKVDLSAASRIREFSMGRIPDSIYYVPTEDTAAVPNKTYYIQNYELVSEPNEEHLGLYYELNNGQYVLTEDESLQTGKNYYEFKGYIETEYTENCYEQKSSSSNLNLTEASFSNNTMLEKLEIIDCPLINNSLDLTKSANLKYLDITDSGFTGVTLASNAPTETLILNHPSTLSLSNLFKVNNFSIQGYDKLTGLYLNNIDNCPELKSKTLTSEAVLNPDFSYNLQSVKWVINNNDEISDANIPLLDRLLEKDARSAEIGHPGVDRSQALTGSLTVSNSVTSVSNSLGLYEKYTVNKYPNLDINFENPNIKLYTILIVDGNNEVIWEKKAAANYKIDTSFLSTGPRGAFNSESCTVKMPTSASVFNFSNSWTIINADTEEEIETILGEQPIYNTALNYNIIIKPNFDESVRQYTITFMNGEEILQTGEYDYETLISSILPNETPRKDDSELDIYETYAFRGYALSSTARTPLVFTDDFKVKNDAIYYAIFTDAINTANSINVHYENFEFVLQSGDNGYIDVNNETRFNIPEGYLVRPAANRKLVGKITIPAYYKDKPIIRIAEFGVDGNGVLSENLEQITGIYFENGTKIREFSSNAFRNLENLKYLEIPDSIRRIGSRALQGLKNLKLIPRDGEGKNSTTYVLGGANLDTVEPYAFNNCIDKDCTIATIPGSVRKAYDGSFSYFNEASRLTQINVGTAEERTSLLFDLNLENDSSYIKLNTGNNPLLQNIYVYLPLGSSLDTTIVEKQVNPYTDGTHQVNISVTTN